MRTLSFFTFILLKISFSTAKTQIEECCWPQELRTTTLVLEQRIKDFAQGQLVLVVADTVVGVIYSQRIQKIDALNGISVAQIDTLHDSKGDIAQLLAVNILLQGPHNKVVTVSNPGDKGSWNINRTD